MTWTLPNILTIFRLICAFLLVIVFFVISRPFSDWVALCIFLGAAATDWLDGHLARRWNQQSRFGAMLDPIADKAMVAIALLALMEYSSLSNMLLLPGAMILFREVFVSGLREFLEADARHLKVMQLAKWKTAVQMVAIAALLLQGVLENYFAVSVMGMEKEILRLILTSDIADPIGVRWKYEATIWAGYAGVGLLWLAALLTVVTGAQYFRRALPFLAEKPKEEGEG